MESMETHHLDQVFLRLFFHVYPISNHFPVISFAIWHPDRLITSTASSLAVLCVLALAAWPALRNPKKDFWNLRKAARLFRESQLSLCSYCFYLWGFPLFSGLWSQLSQLVSCDRKNQFKSPVQALRVAIWRFEACMLIFTHSCVLSVVVVVSTIMVIIVLSFFITVVMISETVSLNDVMSKCIYWFVFASWGHGMGSWSHRSHCIYLLHRSVPDFFVTFLNLCFQFKFLIDLSGSWYKAMLWTTPCTWSPWVHSWGSNATTFLCLANECLIFACHSLLSLSTLVQVLLLLHECFYSHSTLLYLPESLHWWRRICSIWWQILVACISQDENFEEHFIVAVQRSTNMAATMHLLRMIL